MELFVSLIIPNYNHAKSLDERICSVLRQTYQNFEVIILDDVIDSDCFLSIRITFLYYETRI